MKSVLSVTVVKAVCVKHTLLKQLPVVFKYNLYNMYLSNPKN